MEREFKERSPRLALDPAWSLYLLFVAFDIASTEQNIRGSFRDAGLMPYNPDAARSIETSMSAYPARARRSPEPGNASLREFKVFAGQARDLSHRYSTMTESQKDHVWEQIRKVTEIFESCTMSTDALQAEMNAIAEDLRKCIRQRSEGKCRPKSVAAVSRTLPKRKILKERAKRHCRGCGRGTEELPGLRH